MNDSNQIINKIINSSYIYGFVRKVEIFVTPKQAKSIKKWWEEKYRVKGTYSILPFLGSQCTTTVRQSLEQAGVISYSFCQSPRSFFEFLSDNAKHTGGINKGKKATIGYIQAKEKPYI